MKAISRVKVGSGLRGWRFAVFIGFVALLATPAQSLADCGGPAWVRQVENAQRVTFVGVFEHVRKEPDSTGTAMASSISVAASAQVDLGSVVIGVTALAAGCALRRRMKLTPAGLR